MWKSHAQLHILESIQILETENYRGTYYSSWRARVPSHWGKRTWDALFLLAADYPHEKECWDDDEYTKKMIKDRKRAWKQMLTSLPSILTCGVCAQHFKKYIERDNKRSLNKALENREELFKFLYKCKDEINKRNGIVSSSYEQIKRKYIPSCKKNI